MDRTPPPRPLRNAAQRWPWLVAAAAILTFAVADVFYPAADTDYLVTAMFGTIVFAFVLVGALLCVRVSSNVIGPLLLGSGTTLAVTIAVGMVATVAATRGDLPVPVIAGALLLNDVGFIVPIVVVLICVPLVFPDGHLLSPRWRWILVLIAAALTAQILSEIFGPGPLGAVEIDNPFAIPALEPFLAALAAFASWTSIIGFVAAVLAVVVRYRRGGEVARHQLKWLIAVAGVAAVAFPLAFIVPLPPVADAAFFTGLLALLALPLAIGVAILRYRLYDIDRIISRTLSWTTVTVVLLVVFAGLVVGLQALLIDVTQGQTLAVAASTLAAFALFQPVRRRVQRAVDRRFDRSRYDSELTAAGFAERLRTEVDLDAVASDLTGSIERTLRPTTLELWLKETGR